MNRVRLAQANDGITFTTYMNTLRDVIFVEENSSGVIRGQLALRPMMFAHSMIVRNAGISPGTRRLISEALFHHAEGFLSHSRSFARPGEWAPYGTIFQVTPGNERMREFILGKGGFPEPDGDVYRLDLPFPDRR